MRTFFLSFGANSIAAKPFEEYKQICFSNMMLNISPPFLLVYLQSLLYNFQDLACSYDDDNERVYIPLNKIYE